MAIVPAGGALKEVEEEEVLAIVEQMAIKKGAAMRTLLAQIETAAQKQLDSLSEQLEKTKETLATAERALAESEGRIAEKKAVHQQQATSRAALESALQSELTAACARKASLRALIDQKVRGNPCLGATIWLQLREDPNFKFPNPRHFYYW